MAKRQKFKERYKIWKEWRINNKNSKFHQWLVLFKLRPSPTFDNFEAWYYIRKGFDSFQKWFDGEENNNSTKPTISQTGMYNVIGKVDSIDCSDDGIKITVSEERKDYDEPL